MNTITNPETGETIELHRECGECYQCCVWLGITELKKYTGQACKHLDGTHPCARCTIYDHRPAACSDYWCMWIAGFGLDNWRPDKSGVLISLYGPNPKDFKEGDYPLRRDEPSVTMHVCNPAKAGSFGDPKSRLQQMVQKLLEHGCNQIRVVTGYHAGATVFYLVDGRIYKGQLIIPPAGDYEGLAFAGDDTPIGRYQIFDAPTIHGERR